MKVDQAAYIAPPETAVAVARERADGPNPE